METLNLWPTVGPGDYRFIDQNEDGQINEEDKVKIGSLIQISQWDLQVICLIKG